MSDSNVVVFPLSLSDVCLPLNVGEFVDIDRDQSIHFLLTLTSSASGLVGSGFVSRYRFQSIEGL